MGLCSRDEGIYILRLLLFLFLNSFEIMQVCVYNLSVPYHLFVRMGRELYTNLDHGFSQTGFLISQYFQYILLRHLAFFHQSTALFLSFLTSFLIVFVQLPIPSILNIPYFEEIISVNIMTPKELERDYPVYLFSFGIGSARASLLPSSFFLILAPFLMHIVGLSLAGLCLCS